MRIIATIEGEDIIELNDLSLVYTSKAAIDSDGIGDHHGDPDAQDQTTLQWGGQSLNADVDKFIVVPPAIIEGVPGIVMGCQAYVTNTKNGMSTEAVVGDRGPKSKLGEISCSCATALGLDPSPIDGGIDEHVIHYHVIPGAPASVDGKSYTLQPA